MSKKVRSAAAICCLVLFCGLTLAQEPVVDLSKADHPNLAEAQRLIVEANRHIALAQTDRRNHFEGHAARARDLLVQVNEELKAAARVADVYMQKHP